MYFIWDSIDKLHYSSMGWIYGIATYFQTIKEAQDKIDLLNKDGLVIRNSI